MSEKISSSGRKFRVTAGWVSLLLGWLCCFALKAFMVRSAWMQTAASYMAILFGIMIAAFAFMAARKREGGHILFRAG